MTTVKKISAKEAAARLKQKVTQPLGRKPVERAEKRPSPSAERR